MPDFRIAVLAAFAVAAPAAAQELTANDIARNVAERPANEGRAGTMIFELEDASGAQRRRTAQMFHSEAADAIRIAIFFEQPASIAETAFLSHDHRSAGRQDENWLYLPVTERVRRLPVSDRGDYFMGTDLTYGDVKDDFKFDLADYSVRLLEHEERNGKPHYRLELRPVSESVARELGYGRVEAWIDGESWFPVDIAYEDPAGEPLKSVQVLEQGVVGGAWTALHVVAEHHQTGHRTTLRFEDMRHVPGLGDEVFDPDQLDLGPPEF